MTLHSTFSLLLLSSLLVSCHSFLDGKTTRGPRKGGPIDEKKALTGNQDRQQRSVGSKGNPEKMLKVFDFSADTDHELDSNGEYTGATLEAGPLPESFTICSAFMVEAWDTGMALCMFTLLDNYDEPWAVINVFDDRKTDG